MRITAILIVLVFVVLAWSNPGMDAFKDYAENHSERLLLNETGDTGVGRVLSRVGGALAGAFVDDVTDRDNYLIFSLYTIDLDGQDEDENEWRFLGLAGQFVEIQQPKGDEDR